MSRMRQTRDDNRVLKIITGAAAVGFVVFAIILVIPLLFPGGSGPKLVVDKEKIDFGRVVYDKTVRAVFTVTNAGDQPLRLSEKQIQVRLVEGC